MLSQDVCWQKGLHIVRIGEIGLPKLAEQHGISI